MAECQREVSLEGFVTVCGAPLERIEACPFATPNCYPGQIIIVIAPDHRWFEDWCRMDNDPPENPRDRKFRIITSRHDATKILGHGRHKREGDKILFLGTPERGTYEVVMQALMPCGFTDMEDVNGRKIPL